jgi:hypothetical protein
LVDLQPTIRTRYMRACLHVLCTPAFTCHQLYTTCNNNCLDVRLSRANAIASLHSPAKTDRLQTFPQQRLLPPRDWPHPFQRRALLYRDASVPLHLARPLSTYPSCRRPLPSSSPRYHSQGWSSYPFPARGSGDPHSSCFEMICALCGRAPQP